ncbi:uncharacterized protein LOC112099895 [Citrus clementina]|uniref:uncharacterized protein LOC112099895 n=1 Tax=Citrus clementina TaxID=85681 RepID=UPI000CED2DC7|nr:uncharacterized protein LOC112099895 [Citrus x clementina]
MSNRKGKLIVDESDEKVDDSYPNLFGLNDPLCSSRDVGPSYHRDTLEYPRPMTTLPSPDLEPVGNYGGLASGSGENHSSEGAGIPKEVGEGKESSSEPSRPSKKRNLGHRMEADAYHIDCITCATTHTNLLKLRNLYKIPEEVLLVIPGKGDVPSQPPKGYVTMHLESFKLGARLPLQPYFVRILGGMYLAPGQLHPNEWRLLSALYVLREKCGLEEPSLVEVKHLYQLRSSLKEANWYYFMSSSAKRKPITGFPSSCKNWKNKFFFTGENWCLAIHSLSGDIHLPTRYVTPESWGLIEKLDDRPLLQVETALVAPVTPPPLKKTNVGSSKASAPSLPPPPPRKNRGEKVSDKSPEVSAQSRDRSSPLPPRDQGDYLTPYQRDYGKLVGPKIIKDIEQMNLSELAGSVQRVSFKLATLVSCYKNRFIRHERRLQADNQDLKKKADSADHSKEKLLELHKQIMDLEEKVAIAKSNSSKLEGELGDLESDLQAAQKYNSGLAFSYKCIMFVLKEEYPELNMSKLEAGVEAPSSGVPEEKVGDRALEAGQGSAPAPLEMAGPPLSEVADPSPTEAAEPHNS